MRHLCFTVFSGLLLGFALPSVAQDAPQWNTSCDGGLCTLSRQLIDEATGKGVATVLVVVQKASDDILLGAALPLGVALEPGVRFVQGDTLIQADFEVCYPDGCRAMAELPVTAFEAIDFEKEMDLRVFAFGQDKPLAVTVPLDSLKSAVDAGREQLKATP